MKYFKYFLQKLKKIWNKFLSISYVILVIVGSFLLCALLEGYSLEDFGLGEFNINPNDYCNLTDVDYTAVVHDDPNGKANVVITEYITFDIHAASKDNPFREVWRELPEDIVDGLKVDYDVSYVAQVLSDGTELPYTKTSKMYWEDEDYTKSSTLYWHHSKASGRAPDNDESLLIYIPWTYRDKLTFKIVYSLNNAALKYKDCSELYLSLYSGKSITKLKSYKAKILVPHNLMPSTYHAYSFGTTNSRIPFTESDDSNYHIFSFSLDKSDLKFNYHNRYIEFCLLAYGNDKHSFTKYAPSNLYTSTNALEECISENEYYETKTNLFKKYKTIALLLSILFTILIVNSSKKKYKKFREKYNFHEPETDYEFFREIPSDLDPIFASDLVFMKDPFNENKEKQEEYAAILLSLVRKKYVTLSKRDSSLDWSNSNTLISLEPIQTEFLSPEFVDSPNYSPEPVYIVKNMITGEQLEPLSTSERLYFDLLERHAKYYKNTILIDQLQFSIDQDFEYSNSFVKDMEKKPTLETGIINGYFQDKNYDVPKKKLINSAKSSFTLGILLLVAVNFFSYFTPMDFAFGAYTILGIACIWRYFYLSAKASNSVLFTQYGANEQAKWYGLYNFLNSDTLINEKGVSDLPLWEKYLIYATAFGISEKVIKAIKIHAIELNIDSSPILNHHSFIHSHHFHTTSRSFGHSLHTTSRGGGGFSGHGYGGGGRGGGGGGGGH